MTTLANDVQVQLADDVLAGDTSILVEAAVAPLNNPPEPPDGESAVLTLVDQLAEPTQIEILTYTTVTDNQDGTWTIGGLTRGQEGTTAQAFNSGAWAFQSATASLLASFLRGPFSDATHGDRGGGTLHGVATDSTPGFMSAADKEKLDGLSENSGGFEFHQSPDGSLSWLEAAIQITIETILPVPIAWWDFEEGAAETEYKSFDEDPALTLKSEVDMLSGADPKTGSRHYAHDGSSGVNSDRDEFILKLDDTTKLDFTDSFTMSCWVKITGTPPSVSADWWPVFATYKPHDGYRGILISYWEDHWRWSCYDQNDVSTTVEGPAPLTNQYQFISVWWDKGRQKIGLQVDDTVVEEDFTGDVKTVPSWPFATGIGGKSGTWTSTNIGDHQVDAPAVWPGYLDQDQRDVIRNGGDGHTIDSLFSSYDLAVVSVSGLRKNAAGDHSVIVYGRGFESGATVEFGGTASPNVTVLNAAAIRCDVPDGSGTVDVTVTQGAESDTLTDGFTYEEPWTPAFYPVRFWADGLDSASVVQEQHSDGDRGELVTWKDKSGRGWDHTQTFSTLARPERAAGGVKFSATDHTTSGGSTRLTLDDVVILQGYPFSCFAVVGPIGDDAGVNNGAIFGSFCDDRDYAGVAKDSIFHRNETHYSLNYNPSPGWPSDDVQLLFGEWLAADDRRARINDGAEETDTNSSPDIDPDAPGNIAESHIGNRREPDGTWGSTPLIGVVREIVSFDHQLTAANRQRFAGYFAHRHGFTAKLDAGHAYKSAPPKHALMPAGDTSIEALGARLAAFADTTEPVPGTSMLTINGEALHAYEVRVIDGPHTVDAFDEAEYFTDTEDACSAWVVVKGDLTIDAGQVFRPSKRKLFTVLYVDGDLEVNGEISMTRRGANHSASGAARAPADIRIYQGTLDSVVNPHVPAAGGAGGAGYAASGAEQNWDGNPGAAGSAGQTGGGGSGSLRRWNTTGTTTMGAGTAGTAFSGGTAAGGAHIGTQTHTAEDAEEHGGKGGDALQHTNGSNVSASGGAGNPGGQPLNIGANNATPGDDGTGGTLIVIVRGAITGSGVIAADGADGGIDGSGNGGGSGGGSVNVLCVSDNSTVTIRAAGGVGLDNGRDAGDGGDGTARVLEGLT